MRIVPRRLPCHGCALVDRSSTRPVCSPLLHSPFARFGQTDKRPSQLTWCNLIIFSLGDTSSASIIIPTGPHQQRQQHSTYITLCVVEHITTTVNSTMARLSLRALALLVAAIPATTWSLVLNMEEVSNKLLQQQYQQRSGSNPMAGTPVRWCFTIVVDLSPTYWHIYALIYILPGIE